MLAHVPAVALARSCTSLVPPAGFILCCDVFWNLACSPLRIVTSIHLQVKVICKHYHKKNHFLVFVIYRNVLTILNGVVSFDDEKVHITSDRNNMEHDSVI